MKRCGLKKEFIDLKTLKDYILNIDYSQYELYLPQKDYEQFGGGVYEDYISFVSFRPEYRLIFKINYKKFSADEFKKNKYQKFFYIDYDTPNLYIKGDDEKKEQEKKSDDNWGIMGSGLSLFPIDKEFTDDKNIVIKIEIREVKIIVGKSPPSPENMKRMLEDVLLRFQDCLE